MIRQIFYGVLTVVVLTWRWLWSKITGKPDDRSGMEMDEE